MKLILTPLFFEYEALKTALGTPSMEREVQGVKVTYFGADLAMAVGGHGKVQFALTTQLLGRELKPSVIVCAGACGALHEGPGMLDLVASEFTIEHDYNLRFEKRPLPKFAGDVESLEKLRKLTAPKIWFGTIASGDEDIIDAVRSRALFELTGSLAVAWEGAGGARAAAFCKIPFLELRTVTDAANEHAPGDFKKNVVLGMKNIAAALKAL